MFTLLPHQKTGVKFLLSREPPLNKKSKIHGAILADTMGLGKTIQTISLILKSTLKTTIIFCPKILCEMWKKEINKFAPELVIHEFNILGSLGNIFDIIHNSQKQKHVIITSYSISWRRKELYQFHYDRIVCDEAHYFKNTKSKLFKSLVKLKSTSRILLTGTPIVNSVKDLKAMMNFITKTDIKWSIETMKIFIKERVIRRSLEDADIILPKLDINIEPINGPDENEKVVKKIHKFSMPYLEMAIRCVQSSTIPTTLNNGFCKKYELQKFKIDNYKLDKITEKIIEENEQCIVFTRFKDEQFYLRDHLLNKNPSLKIELLNGTTSKEQRDIICSDRSINVLIVQIIAAGVGLNLQHFRRSHFTSIPWNPATLDQAIGRINRIGQKNDMKVSLYIYNKTFDQVMMNIINKKREQIEELLS